MLYLLCRVFKVRRSMRLYFCLFLSLRLVFYSSYALAFDPSSLHGSSTSYASAIEDIVKFKASSAGSLVASEASALPSALTSAAGELAVGEAAAEGLALATPVGWLALGAAAVLGGAAAGVKYCIDSGCSLSWLSSSDSGKVDVPASSGPVISPSTGYWFVGQNKFKTICSTSAACAALYTQYLVSNPNYISYGLKITSSDPPVLSDHEDSYDAYTFTYHYNDGYAETASEMFEVHHSDISQTCVGAVIDTLAECSKTASSVIVPSEYLPSTEMGYQSASSSIDAKYGIAKVSDQSLAAVADSVWKRAASNSGYAGPAYHQVTADDVASWRRSGGVAPTVADAASSVGTYEGADAPLANAVDFPSSDSSAGGSNSRSDVPSNFYDSPDVSQPSDPVPPLISQILDPIFSLFPGLSRFTVHSQAASCPKLEVHLFDKDISADTHCQLIEANRATIAAIALVVYAAVSLLIVLSA